MHFENNACEFQVSNAIQKMGFMREIFHRISTDKGTRNEQRVEGFNARPDPPTIIKFTLYALFNQEASDSHRTEREEGS